MKTSVENQPSLRTTSELIAGQLRQAILRGELKSHQPLRQDKLAEEMGVSKIPVREALAQLKAEGLVTYKSNRGAFVTALSAAEAHEIYLMRLALEPLALAQALPRYTPQDLAHAAHALALLDLEGDPAGWMTRNWAFHAALYQPAAMPHLLATLEQLHLNVGRYQVLYLDSMNAYAQSQREHHDLLNACQNADLAGAQTVLRNHLSKASSALTTYLQQEEESQS
ncbi:MAG TPA: GntR family transcriptional regulator [Caldilineaceae bacterium]|nr:GntR family transcriptional regulator [Caldilineaceae bacterium]